MKPNNILDITRTRGIFLSHRCSVCGYKVVHACNVITLVRVGYDFGAEKAHARAEEVATSQMDALIGSVISCREKPRSLATLCPDSKLNPWQGIQELEIDSKTRSMTRITGLTEVCPICGNLEPWQRIGAQSALRSLTPECFPTVFDDYQRAELDALIDLQSVQEKNEAMRLDVDQLAKAREEHARLLDERDAVTKALQDDSIQQQVAELEAKKEQLEADHKAAGLMAFKAKKEIGAKIDELSKQIDELSKQAKAKKTELSRTLRINEFSLERSKVALAPNGGAHVESIWTSSARALRLFTE